MPNPTTITDVTLRNTIQSRQGPWNALTVVISFDDVTADANGKKIVPAGTIIGTAIDGETIIGSGALAKPANDATAEGLTMNTVDVTHGNSEVSMLYMGTVGLDRIPAAPSDEARAALGRVTFTKD